MRGQRVLAFACVGLTAVSSAMALTGFFGPTSSVTVIDTFEFFPVPLAFFLLALGLAAACLSNGFGVLDRGTVAARYFGVLAAVGAVALVAGYSIRSGPGLWIGLGLVAALTLALVWALVVRGVWPINVALVASCVAVALGLVMLIGPQSPTGSPAWWGAIAAHRVYFQFAFVAFVGVVILAPLQLLGHFTEREHLVRPLAAVAHRPVLLMAASLVAGLCLAWVAVARAKNPTGVGFWLGPLIASAVALLLIGGSTWRPLRVSGMRFAAVVVAVAVALKYVVLGAQPFTGLTPDQTFEIALRVSGWAWVVLLGGALWLVGRERGLNAGGLLLLLALAAELLWRTAHVGLGATKVTAAVLIVIAVVTSVILLLSRTGWAATETKRRLLVAFARAAALAIGAAAVGEIAPAALETALYGAGVVLASLGVLLFRQPGRGRPVPHRGAVFLQAAAAAVLLVTAQALLASTSLGVTISLGAEREVADLMVLPLLVVLASFADRTAAQA